MISLKSRPKAIASRLRVSADGYLNSLSKYPMYCWDSPKRHANSFWDTCLQAGFTQHKSQRFHKS